MQSNDDLVSQLNIQSAQLTHLRMLKRGQCPICNSNLDCCYSGLNSLSSHCLLSFPCHVDEKAQGKSSQAAWPVPAQTNEQPEVVPQQEHQQETYGHQQPSQLPSAAATSLVLPSSPLPIALRVAPQAPFQEPADSSANEEKEVLVASKKRFSWLAYITGADIAAHARPGA